MSKLKRCPFCGGEAKIDKTIANTVSVECTVCHASSRMILCTEGDIEQKAIEAWNTRKPMKNIVERLEEENTLLKEQRTEAIEYDDEQIIFATNNQIRAFDYSLRVIKEEGGINDNT